MNRFGDIDYSFKRLPPVYGYHVQQIVSLEKALEPIESQIDELPRFIIIAKQYCHFPSEHGLSKDQSAAIYIYTMEWGDTSLYRILNNALRSQNRQALKIWFPYLKLFETALDKLPTIKEILWRGVPLDIGKSFMKDQIVTWWSVNSCSSSIDVIKSFLERHQNSTLFLIEAMNGKKISGYTEYENESEIILRIGTHFRVKSNALDHPNGSHVVHLVEILDNNEPMAAAAIDELQLLSSDLESSFSINNNSTWTQDGITIAGGNDEGNHLNQLYYPHGIYVDDEKKSIYIADCWNHRIVKWKYNAKNGKVIAGGNGEGNRHDQLKFPTDVIVDKNNDSIIICDRGNRRIIRCSRQKSPQIILSDIHCRGITMNHKGDLYISDYMKYEVRRWKTGDLDGKIVAGGNGNGNDLDQLNQPTFIFIDQDYSIYVSDRDNHRVMKWMKGAKEGIIVAGGHGQGDKLTQLSNPRGVTVDHLGNVYVADYDNHRIMRWLKGSSEGEIIVGGNGSGQQANQLNCPVGLSFDRESNLYVVDMRNNRVQKFDRNE